MIVPSMRTLILGWVSPTIALSRLTPLDAPGRPTPLGVAERCS